jgi:hypothetical protein
LEKGGIRDPYRVPFLPEAQQSPNQEIEDCEDIPKKLEAMKWQPQRSPNQEIGECEDIPKKLEAMKWKAWLSYNAVVHMGRWRLEEMAAEPKKVDPQLQALRDRLQGLACQY